MARRPRGLIPNSLQLRLSASLIAAIAVVAMVAAVFSYRSAYDEAIELQDGQLREAAALVGRFDTVPAAARAIGKDLARATGQDEAYEGRITFGRIGRDGRGLPAELAGLPAGLDNGFHTRFSQGTEWRVFVAGAADDRTVVAQPTAVRDDVAHDGAVRALLPPLLLIPVLLLVVGDIIRRMFAPLRALAADVDARADDDLGAIADGGLPAEIGPLIKAMNRLLGRVGLAMTAQRRFVADAAHELRTPLTALTLQAERLDAVDMSREARNRVATLRRGLQRSSALLEQLLALARMQQATGGDTPATRVDPVLRSVIATLMPLADRRSIDLGIVGDADVVVPMRELDLSMLLRNLIDNAVRYTQPGGKVDIAVGFADGRATIEVRDDGPGIPAAERDIVFEPFHRLAGDAEGSGLGLAIVKAIADRYRAEVAVADAGPGTCVTITLPPTDR